MYIYIQLLTIRYKYRRPIDPEKMQQYKNTSKDTVNINTFKFSPKTYNLIESKKHTHNFRNYLNILILISLLVINLLWFSDVTCMEHIEIDARNISSEEHAKNWEKIKIKAWQLSQLNEEQMAWDLTRVNQTITNQNPDKRLVIKLPTDLEVARRIARNFKYQLILKKWRAGYRELWRPQIISMLSEKKAKKAIAEAIIWVIKGTK